MQRTYIHRTSLVAAFVVATVVVQHASAEFQLRSGDFLHHQIQSQGNDLEDGAAPLIPQIQVTDALTDYVASDAYDAPEGGTQPWAPGKQVVHWPEHSKLPLWGQWVLGFSWVGLLCAIPLIMPLLDKKPLTKTQCTVGSLMLIVVLGGFYLFTNIILFQSIHFKTIRPLTVVECIYFMSQVITTVGYGDITPAKIRGQVFVGMYVLGALFLIAMMISDLTNRMVVVAKQYSENLKKQQAEEDSHRIPSARTPKTIQSLITPEKPTPQKLLVALATFGTLDLCWVLFFYLHPGEGKTLFQALYMSVITLSSVGFGYFTPVTEEGMIFGAFWMLLGTSALVNVISNFTELMVKLNEWESFRPESKAAAVDTLKGLLDGSQEVTESQFLKFGLLQMKCVNMDELKHIHEAFENLKPQKGSVSLKAIEDHLAQMEEASAIEAK